MRNILHLTKFAYKEICSGTETYNGVNAPTYNLMNELF